MNNPSAAAPILRVDNVCKSVATAEGQLSILDSVSLEINAGESVAVVGASGSGKTTLVLVTHDTALADRCGRVLILEAGRIAT